MNLTTQRKPGFFHKTRFLNVIKICLIVLMISACTTAGTTPEPRHLTIAGSTAMLPLLQDLAHAYERKSPNVTLEVHGGGSQFGITAARSRQVDIGMTSRPLRADEEKDPATGNRTLWATPIAYDGVAVIINTQNNIANLSTTNLRAIFSGAEWNWAFVGGMGAETIIISREEGSGTRAVFEDSIMQGTNVTPRAIIMPHSAAVIDFVAQNPAAVGYATMGYLAEKPATATTIALDEVPCTATTVAAQEYPLTRTLFLLTSAQPSGEAQAFIDFVLSKEGQSIVSQRYVSIKN